MLSINCRNYETSLIVLSYSYRWGCTDITMECLSNNLWAGSPSIPFNIINIPMSRSAVLQATFKSWVWCFHPTFVAFKRLGFHIPPPENPTLLPPRVTTPCHRPPRPQRSARPVITAAWGRWEVSWNGGSPSHYGCFTTYDKQWSDLRMIWGYLSIFGHLHVRNLFCSLIIQRLATDHDPFVDGLPAFYLPVPASSSGKDVVFLKKRAQQLT
jgi:hypothetical protein